VQLAPSFFLNGSENPQKKTKQALKTMLFENTGCALKKTVADPFSCLDTSRDILKKTLPVYKHKSYNVSQTQRFPGTVIQHSSFNQSQITLM